MDDRERDVCEPVVAMLRTLGHRAEFAVNKDQALRLLSQQPFDAALVDWNLDHSFPLGDLDLLGTIKRRWPQVQVVMFSGLQPRAEVVATAMQLGALDFLSKPIGFDKLARAIALFRRVRETDTQEELVAGVKADLRQECGLPTGELHGRVGKLVGFLEENYGKEAFGSSEIAQAWLEAQGETAERSPLDLETVYRQGCERFKHDLKMSPVGYLHELRLRVGYALVCHASLRFEEIAERCGFACYETFRAAFVKKYGRSPRKVRAQGGMA